MKHHREVAPRGFGAREKIRYLFQRRNVPDYTHTEKHRMCVIVHHAWEEGFVNNVQNGGLRQPRLAPR